MELFTMLEKDDSLKAILPKGKSEKLVDKVLSNDEYYDESFRQVICIDGVARHHTFQLRIIMLYTMG